MKCLETEKLIRYAYRLTDEAALSEVRAHLGECSHCREIIEQYGRLDTLLNDWRVAGPTPEFDVRVRQALETRQSKAAPWGLWNPAWVRSLSLAGLAALVMVGVIWIKPTHRRVPIPAVVVGHLPLSAKHAHAEGVAVRGAADTAPNTSVAAAKSALATGVISPTSSQDTDAQALEDYDMAANFDVLSELPKGDLRGAD